MRNTNQLGRRFWQLWSAATASSVGDGMVFVGFPLLALTLTHDPVTIAGVVVADRLPALLVGLPVGALADRVDRRRLLVAIELMRMTVMAGFAAVVVTGSDSVAALYLAVFALGALTVSFDVVSSAALPSVVAEDQLVAANARLMTAEIAGEDLAGQAVGGVAFAAARCVPFVGDGASFLASALLLRRAVPSNQPSPTAESMWSDLRSGVRWVLSHRLLRLLFSVVAAFAFCQAMVAGVLVLYATERLHLSASGYGLLLAAASVSSFAGSWLTKPLHDRLGTGGSIVVAGVMAAAAYPVMALTRSPVVAGAAILVESLGVVICVVASSSLRQAEVPAEMQGRAASAYRTLVLGMVPLGSLAGGLLTDRFGLRTAMVSAGVLQMVVVAATSRRLIRRIHVRERRLARQAAATAPGALVGMADGVVDLREPSAGGAVIDLRHPGPESPMAAVIRRLQEALDESETGFPRVG